MEIGKSENKVLSMLERCCNFVLRVVGHKDPSYVLATKDTLW